MWPILKRPSAFSKMRQTAAVNIILEATAHPTGRCTDDHSYNRAVFNYLNLHPFFSKLFTWVYSWNCEKHRSHFTESHNCFFVRKRGAFRTQMLLLFLMNEKYKQPQQSEREKFDACLVNSQFHIFTHNICGFCQQVWPRVRWGSVLCLTSWLR